MSRIMVAGNPEESPRQMMTTEADVPKPLTHGEMARHIARIARTATNAMVTLAEGSWNPNFVSAECSAFALSVCEDLRSQLDHLAGRIK